MVSVASVELWGKRVGALAHNPESGLSAFEYDPEWRKAGLEINPRQLPLSAAGSIFEFPRLANESFKGLPGCFADSLPDDFGNSLIDAWLARQGRSPRDFNAVERLLYTGKRGIGALEYAPAIERGDEVLELELQSLLEVAQAVLDQRAGLLANIDGSAREAGLRALFQVGTSAGGARAKAVIGINRARTEIRSGQCDLPEGFDHYILKFDGISEKGSTRETFGDPQGFGRMEYAYYLMARAARVDMSHCELLHEGERAHFMTQRFDRVGNHKLHYQSLCALEHADYKKTGSYSYEQLFSLLRSMRFKKAQALQMFRRMVFNIIARNHDDHSKNFGFLMDREGQWHLAPAFDIAFSYKPGSPWVNSHQLSLNGKRDNFSREDLLTPAQSFRQEAEQIIDEINEVVSRWPHFAREAGVDPEFSQYIAGCHRLNL